jgi:hypothetical protein
MKAGVWRDPWGVVKTPARALSDLDSRAKWNGAVSDAYR